MNRARRTRQAGILALATLAVLGAVLVIAIRMEHLLGMSQGWVQHTLIVRYEVSRLLIGLEEAASAPLLEHARQGLPARLGRLRELTADNPAQQQRLAQLETAISALLRPAQEGERASPGPASQGYKASLDEARRLAHELDAEEARLLEVRTAQAQRTQKTLRLLLLLLGGGLVLLAATDWVLRQRSDRAERDRLRSEQRLRHFMDANLIGIISWESGGSITAANEAFLQTIGYTREDLETGRINWKQLTPPEWRAQDETLVVELRETGKHRAAEKEYLRKDGTRVPILVASTFFPGSRTEGVGFILDISSRKHAEQRLRASERKFSLMFNVAPFAAVLVRLPRGELTDVNQAWLELMGYRKEEVLGRTSLELGMFPQPEERTRLYERFFRDGHVRNMELDVRSKSGAVHRVSCNMDRLELEGAAYLVGCLQDVTERTRAEEALQASEEQFRTLADSISQLVWIAEADGSIHWYNRRWYEYTGTTPAQMADESGWGWKQVHDPEHLPRVIEHFQRAIASGEPWEDSFPLRRKDGEFRWHLSRAMPMRDARGRIVRWFGTNTDVEEQRRQAAALQEAIQARDVFLQVAAHELRTPLTSLMLRLERLQRASRQSVTEPHRSSLLRDLELGQSQVRKLTGLIHALLDVSRISSGRLHLQPEPVELCSLVQEVAERFEPDASRAGCRLEVQADCEAQGVWDRMRLEQVLANLLSNAFKYGPGKPVRVGVTVEGGLTRLAVQDEGMGIPPEVLPRLFGKFERGVSERHYGGLGLGLWLTREIVRSMGGSVRVETAPGLGARFTVELPLVTREMMYTSAQGGGSSPGAA